MTIICAHFFSQHLEESSRKLQLGTCSQDVTYWTVVSARLHPMAIKQCCLGNEVVCTGDGSSAVAVEWNGTNEITLLVKKEWSYLWSKCKELVSFCLWYFSFQATETYATFSCIKNKLFLGFLKLGPSGLLPNFQVCVLVTDVREFCPERLQLWKLLNCPERLTPNESRQLSLLIILSSICCLQTCIISSGLSVSYENRWVSILAVFSYYSNE